MVTIRAADRLTELLAERCGVPPDEVVDVTIESTLDAPGYRRVQVNRTPRILWIPTAELNDLLADAEGEPPGLGGSVAD